MVLSALAIPARAAIQWTQWTSETIGVPGSAWGTNAIGVGVSYSGEVQGPVPGLIPPNCPSWEPATTFSGGTVSNPPPSDYGCIPLSGGNPGVNTITFSQPVVDPVMAIWSLGQPGLTASFVFQTIQPISIESGGPSSEYSFGKSITQMHNSIRS